jgi:hypothetical protein
VPTIAIRFVGIVFILLFIDDVLKFRNQQLDKKLKEFELNKKLIPIKNDLLWAIQNFFTNDEVERVQGRPTFSQLGVTDINVEMINCKIIFTITLFRPGSLIGRSGIQFDELKSYLSRVAQIEVLIKILEPTFMKSQKTFDN